MKGKRHTTDQKIRILREADGGKSIVEVSKEHNISEVTFHRWKRQPNDANKRVWTDHYFVGAVLRTITRP